MSDGVLQTGTITPGHALQWTTDGVVQDAGPATNGTLTELGITKNGGIALGINSAPIMNPGGYVQGGIGVSQSGVVTIYAGSFDGAPPASLVFEIDGTIYPVSVASGIVLITNIATLRVNSATVSQVYVQGYYSPGDGGEGLFWYDATDTTSADNGGTIIIDAAGRRWHRDTGGQPYSVKWFGATGGGTVDDTNVINAACTAAAANDATVYWPPGVYLVSAPLVITGAGHYYGAGIAVTTIITNSPTADIIQITQSNVTLSDLLITSSVTKTAGISVNITGSYVDVERLYISAFFIGMALGSASVNPSGIHIRNIRLFQLAATATQIGIEVLNGVDLVIDTIWCIGSTAGNLQFGVLVTNCGDVTIRRLSTVYAGDGLAIEPAAGQTVQAVFVSASYFDTGTGYGIYVNATGVVQLVKIEESWAATNALGGLALQTTGGGEVQQTDVHDSLFSNSTAGNGVTIASAAVVNSTFIGCSMSANTNGFVAGTGVTAFKLIGCTLGTSGEFTGNSGSGIVLDGSNDQFSIVDNRLVGNTTAAIGYTSFPIYNAGVTFFVARNQGFVTNNYGVLITTAGPTSFTVTHGLAVTPLLEDITLTLLSGLGTATYFYPTAITATTFTITFNAAPGVNVNIGWRVRSMGS